MRASELEVSMIVQVLPGDAPMRIDRIEKATHNGKPCLVLHGVQAVGGGKVEPVEFWVGHDHTVWPWPLRAA